MTGDEFNKKVMVACNVVLTIVRMGLVISDESKLFRRAAFAIAIWLQVKATIWCFSFAQMAMKAAPDQGLEVAAIVGAIMTPLSAFVAATFKFYSDTRGTPDNNTQIDGGQTLVNEGKAP